MLKDTLLKKEVECAENVQIAKASAQKTSKKRLLVRRRKKIGQKLDDYEMKQEADFQQMAFDDVEWRNRQLEKFLSFKCLQTCHRTHGSKHTLEIIITRFC